MEHAFGRVEPFAVGVEEELLLVDPETHALAHLAGGLLSRLGDRIKPDFYEAEVETASPISRDAAEAVAALGDTRADLRAAGATLVGAGIHPAAPFGDVQQVPGERYDDIAATMRGLMHRTPTCALHVHVGMPDPETAIAACNGLRAFLPVLQGLAAHSPFWHGLDSGFATARAQLFRGLPSAVIPPEFAGWEDYLVHLAAWEQAGGAPDYTHLWWDVRPHPSLGTVEVRAMDAQSRLGSVRGLATLVHGLAIACAQGPPPAPAPPGPALTATSFRAGRDGLDATIWWRGTVRELAAAAVERARPGARTVGAEAALEEIERILRDGNGAQRMRAAHAEGGMARVVERLIAESAEPLEVT